LGKSLRRALTYALVRILMSAAQRLPRSTCLRLFGAGGLLARRALRADRVRTEVNLSVALPQLTPDEARELGKKVWVDLGKNSVDVLRLPRLNWRDLLDFVEIEGQNYLDEALSRGKGVIAVTGHIGSWELLGAYFSMMGYPLSVIVRPLRDQRFEKLIDELRRSKGMRPISRMGNVKAAYECLKRGHILGVLTDQDTSVKGVFCDFFGRPAFTPAGPAVLAMRTGAAVVPMAVQMQEDGIQLIRVKEPIQTSGDARSEADVRRVMQRCSDAIEDLIRSHLTQWVWMHDRWKTFPTESDWKETGKVSA
jgi:KDO2-lipid IV(A) lauroyltransferase